MRRASYILAGLALMAAAVATAGGRELDTYRANRGKIEQPAVALARRAVEIRLGIKPTQPAPPCGSLLKSKAAVFVTISKNGRRRGCKGSFEPATQRLCDEIARAAVGAATTDVRYRPLRSSELKDVIFSVSIVGAPRQVRDAGQYPPGRYGLLLRSGSKSGVLLPGEAKTCSWRLAEAKRQAGLKPGDRFELYVFEAVTFAEHRERRR